MMRPNTVQVVLVVINVLLMTVRLCGAADQPRLRPFTIQDSIELSQFANPVFWSTNWDRATEPIVSPDGKRILLVTFRGVLADNTVESTISMFDQQAISQFALKVSTTAPSPKIVAQFAATCNTPVITDVRWLSDSKRIAFLAKAGPATRQQLYVVHTDSGQQTRITDGSEYVSGYDIEGDTIVYTTLSEPAPTGSDQGDLVSVTGQNIFSLLWRDRELDERPESQLLNVQNVLHVIKSGREMSIQPLMNRLPLRLFFPILSLSPDEQSLVTIAAVSSIPTSWDQYKPFSGYEDLKLTPSNKLATSDDNRWKAAQLVVLDLDTGVATPLLDAPAGRSLFFNFAPTKATWSRDSRRLLVSNTFLPFEHQGSDTSAANSIRATVTAAAIVDVASHHLQPIAFFHQPARNADRDRQVSDVSWGPQDETVRIAYASSPDNLPLPFQDLYEQTSNGWIKKDRPEHPPLFVHIEQDLNHPPALVARSADSQKSVTIWNPNPQLASIALGHASIYHWRDKEGTPYTGILVLPADYVPGRRYPLVIQTHGYEPQKFFVDGIYTTGSGGRALADRDVIILQMGQVHKNAGTAQEGRSQVESFEGAIHQLTADGLIDPHRVGVIGFSFTVFHVLYALTHRPDLFAAASITDGNDLSYWLYLLWTDIPFAQRYAERMNGGAKPFGKKGLLRWKESAPGFNLEHVRAPLLISCFEKGTLVTTWDIYGGLRTLGKPVDLIWLRKEDAPHVLVQPRHRYLSQQNAVDWFDFWLNGHEDSDPRKAAMYSRWHTLKAAQEKQVSATDVRPSR